MANLSISEISARIFNTSKHETSVARNSNPFAKSNMKMDVLTADVFGTKSNSVSFTGGTNTFISKARRMCSTFVGSINNLGNDFRQTFESIGAFCNRMKNGITSAWNYLHTKEVPSITDMTRSIKANWDAKNYDKAVNKLAQNPVSDLETMLVNELSLSAAA